MYIRGPILTQSEATAAQRTFTFEAVDATDGFTPETAHTYAGAEVQVSKNGGAFATSASVATHVANGVFQVVVAEADLDTLGEVLFRFADASSRTVYVACQVTAFDLNAALTATTVADAALDGRTKNRTIAMAAAAGDFIFDGADTGLGYEVVQALSGVVTVTGTWDSATATLQVCADPRAAVPVWSTHGTPLTANGNITITAPVRAIRLVTSGGGGSTALVANAIVTEPV
jgi:hypothetical protein